ncbi:predicted protein [Aspergillus nidulans FGSC A4]|uniref:Uncharacterized protein n=1 Tax=Emericella nidulans (strain FGSC A4 / ATCC 38163 / CBS 112.46 / NRRL 194 / M139) TaxID=227321 RepID=Q5B795_EMENI|nr:hypothetical protein [Aspergillus nidulans FGSC A4]EAA59793.1 predicted protein [Aspergillus nidulans FGSC A4]CBF75833.1 TPA: hypothetical protein ANIA_03585 [Aspergillus nidulans FGSC A4]|eukprot:XP_661189.1 predicted protein [Aspergillus nidulans FGSC A4]
MTDTKTSDPRDRSVSALASASTSASNPADSTTTSAQTKKQTQSNSQSSSLYPGLGANFAHDPKAPFSVNYDQEVYFQFMAGEEGTDTGSPDANKNKNKNKTLNQIYREEWVRRALNPAISDPRGDPSPIDFECAESQRIRERF